MGFAAAAARIWPVPPEWSRGVSERLAWETDVMHASATAVSQHRGLRIGPARQFSFEILAEGAERRVADMLLAGHRGQWMLPIWPDVQWLGAVAAAAEEIPCATAGYDFVAGGQAVLYASVNQWELVEIDTIEADHLALAAPTVAAFPAGSRLYPVRRARVETGAEERQFNAALSRRNLSFLIDEPCDWPALVDPTLYLTHPVLDVVPDESSDPTASYDRLLQVLDDGIGKRLEYDLADQALRVQKSGWKLFGRAQHSWFRSLLYTLDGRRVPIWVPSFAEDLRVNATVAGGSTSMSVEWAGYTLFGKARHNRKDLRLELDDGSVLYRRISNAVEAGASETLTLSAALDAGSIAPGRIRRVSFMALCTLASDAIDIEHATDQDGVATATTGWQAVVPDV